MSFASFDVQDYGADLSGKTDSYQAFQDWANAITAQGGGTGLVPPGIYKIDKVLDWDGDDVYNSSIRNDDHPFVEGGDDILSICGSRNVSIRNMRIHHAWTDGISVRRTYPVAPSTMGISPADWSAETGTPSGLRFVILENCEFVDSKGVNVVINVCFSHFVVRGCFFNNSSNSDFPCIFSVLHCSIQDSEIDTGTGRIDVALTGTQPGGNVFTIERCLIRASSGQGLAIIPQQGFIAQALIANCRFICEATSPTENGFPVVETGRDLLMLTFRDNYTFIPSASYSKEEPQKTIGFKVCSTVAASLAENNVWETDYAGDDTHYLGVYYHTDFSEYPKYPILVRNDRFISPNNKGIIPFDATNHDNHFPFSSGSKS